MSTSMKNTMLVAYAIALCFGVGGCDKRNRADGSPTTERTAGEELDDKTLTANVKVALEADSVKYPDVQVSSYRGIVQLSGFVDAREHKNRAGDLAQKVPGVKKVENNITLKEERKL